MSNRPAPIQTITDDVKVTFGREAYSRRLDCPTCDKTGRYDGVVCGRCSGAGFVWAKPAAPTEAEKAEADAKLAAEAERAAKVRAAALAIRDAARRRRAASMAVHPANSPAEPDARVRLADEVPLALRQVDAVAAANREAMLSGRRAAPVSLLAMIRRAARPARPASHRADVEIPVDLVRTNAAYAEALAR